MFVKPNQNRGLCKKRKTILNLRDSETWTLPAGTNGALPVHRYSGIYPHQKTVIPGKIYALSCTSIHPV
jgi:hypothetical protein